MEKQIIARIFAILSEKYGFQGWWPVYSLRKTSNRDDRGYLKVPLNEGIASSFLFEIAVGSVLTQNTAWINVEKAIENLESAGLLDPSALMEADITLLSEAIRPSGYYNQKTKKLRILISFLLEGGYLDIGNAPERTMLLELWGIGKETADSILLYAFNLPFFVVDTYTRRIFSRLQIITGKEEYDKIAEIFMAVPELDSSLYGEYHALIVRHAKDYCRKKPACTGCVLRDLCSGDYRITGITSNNILKILY